MALLAGLLVALGGCRSKKEVAEGEEATAMPCPPIRDVAPQVLLMNFEFFDNDSLQMLNTAMNTARLRNRGDEAEPAVGDLVFSFQTASREECTRVVVPNPLVRQVEFSEDRRQLETRTIELEVAIFSVRVQFHPNMRYLQVDRLTPEGMKPIRTLLLH
jgi:hypothetical protein